MSSLTPEYLFPIIIFTSDINIVNMEHGIYCGGNN